MARVDLRKTWKKIAEESRIAVLKEASQCSPYVLREADIEKLLPLIEIAQLRIKGLLSQASLGEEAQFRKIASSAQS
jgi:hypothetical protein